MNIIEKLQKTNISMNGLKQYNTALITIIDLEMLSILPSFQISDSTTIKSGNHAIKSECINELVELKRTDCIG
ncbi:hypothetical protein RclHR1_02740006 [Rhizophagus clarus]|uniref:Uncharacterized protein n=1 Tax=Rhizophagus clarus TaxID=94130 RepID=A0A2Z6R319_9GLOM|nr:hypothetical protein RclHR1_02740006 [Rhizophagus clarus]GES88823.1 hypothetical protein RCL_e12050_RclHR1_02740006 [Rhizophagus clarus]